MIMNTLAARANVMTDLSEEIDSSSFTIRSAALESVIYMNTEAMLESMFFNRNSVEAFISNSLTCKMEKAEANLVAFELGQLINSSKYKNGSTIEEHAFSREIGLRLAEDFSRKYINDPDIVKTFMESIKGFAERDEMLDKGYYFWEGTAHETYKPHPLDTVWKRHKKFSPLPYSKKEIRAFEAGEKHIVEIINSIKTKVSDQNVDDRLEQLMQRISVLKNKTIGDTALYDEKWIRDIHKSYYSW